MSDLDERLRRYAHHLDEHVARFEVPVDAAPPVRVLDDRRSVDLGPAPRHRAWLATAAALVLIAVGSLAWWRSSATDQVGGTDTSVAPLPGIDAEFTGDDSPITWSELERPSVGGWGVPDTATSFRGGVLAVSGNGLFEPLSWWAPDGRTFEEPVVVDERGGAPRSMAADDRVAVAVGNGSGVAMVWVTADGRTWDAEDLSDADSVATVARTPLGFVIVGSSGLGVDGRMLGAVHPAAWSSRDGRSWTRLEIPDPGPGVLTDVAASDGLTALVGSAGGRAYAQVRWTDADGTPVWQSLTADPSDQPSDQSSGGAVTDVAWVGDGFVAISDDGTGATTVWRSAGTEPFVPLDLGRLADDPAASVGFTDVTGARGTVVLVADAGPDAPEGSSSTWARAPGSDWRQASPPDLAPPRVMWVGAGDGRFLAIAAGGQIWAAPVP